jgi:uncharacterized protein YqeY
MQMSLEQTLGADIVTAMKAKDATKLTALRMLKTALTNKSIEKGRALEGAEELQVVSMLVKQRRDFDRAVHERRTHRSCRQGTGRDRDPQHLPARVRIGR